MDRYKQETNEKKTAAHAPAAEANKTAAEAAKETAIAKLAAEKLRLRLVWRQIDPEARKRLTEAMKKFAPQPFAVLTYADDAEPSNLAALIRKSLEDAGWRF